VELNNKAMKLLIILSIFLFAFLYIGTLLRIREDAKLAKRSEILDNLKQIHSELKKQFQNN
jgi:sensor domain CHASE-containing protein